MLQERFSGESGRIKKHHALSEAYNYWFEVVAADNTHLLDRVHRLRYQVYCIENSFESPTEHPDMRETDQFDCRSTHSLLIDKSDGASVGTVRLIFPDHNSLESSFPIQQVCSHPLLSDRKLLLTNTAVEISRFAVTKNFRLKTSDAKPPEANTADIATFDKRALAPWITLGLMKAVVQMSVEHGVTDWFALMEPALLRLLARFGIYFRPIGSLVEFHGKRQPCHARVEELLRKCRLEHPEAFDFVASDARIRKKLSSVSIYPN